MNFLIELWSTFDYLFYFILFFLISEDCFQISVYTHPTDLQIEALTVMGTVCVNSAMYKRTSGTCLKKSDLLRPKEEACGAEVSVYFLLPLRAVVWRWSAKFDG